jgi:1,4-alpha-glucan branching enzyme
MYTSEVRPNNASIIFDMNQYTFHDDAWMNQRFSEDMPINVYEMHFGSWKKPGEKADDWYTYREMADLIIPYLKENHYNFLEIMPLNEYPNDLSWGYQPTGYFAPTSRYGTPDDLRYFVEKCHENNIAVILDFVPVHFAIDGFGLNNYDGTPLYNNPNDAVGKSEWGTCNFQHSRGDVCSFLNSSAYYWLKKYHIDGLRLDAVGNLIYWQGNSGRGENREAIRFVQNFNKGLKQRVPHTLLFAEDSSSYQGVTRPVDQGGLGFDYKWDLGWMNDTLDYFMKTPEERPSFYHKLTFSMMYFYNEHFILPFSHDEVVHGKKTIIDKMYGEYEEKFAQVKALYMYMFAHPGKKLNFMGNEIAMFREWDETKEPDWFLLKYPIHDSFLHFMRELNNIYLTHPSLSQYDFSEKGFKWVDCHQEQDCIYVFKRMSDQETIVAFFNFHNVDKTYTYKVDQPETLNLLLNSDNELYSGKSHNLDKEIHIKNEIEMTLPAYSAQFYIVK